MFSIEKSLEVKSTFYFRLSTLDYLFMEDINDYGSEASYHFEELATYAKQNKIYSSNEILKHLPKIQKKFLDNINDIKKNISFSPVTVASHGDFANRSLKVANHILLEQSVREKTNLKFDIRNL